MENPNPSFRLRLLAEALTVLAADAQTQVAWLVKHRLGADEIALDFEHALRVAEGLAEESLLDRAVLLHLREIDAVFNGMSGAESTDRWTLDALSADEGWARTRELARLVLAAHLGGWEKPLPQIGIIR
ncbi:hypothetical protein ACH41H_37825 [Streptomyces sp. NPDC020800]|uniref:hypothetical protein n=1 Tax=Streptomyces sp. NPDC020800 TaxID=3365092 RepID=UPI003799BD23